MSSFQVSAVHVQRSPSGTHEHITAVRIGADATVQLSVATVVADLRNPYGDRYYTYGGGEYAQVYVRACPHCASRDYITTHPDSTTKNNLLSLPRF